jgi:hypothetical protein
MRGNVIRSAGQVYLVAPCAGREASGYSIVFLNSSLCDCVFGILAGIDFGGAGKVCFRLAAG